MVKKTREQRKAEKIFNTMTFTGETYASWTSHSFCFHFKKDADKFAKAIGSLRGPWKYEAQVYYGDTPWHVSFFEPED